MAIDQQTAAKPRFGFVDKPPQCPVIRAMEAVDAALGLGEGQLAGVDFLAARDDAGNRAEPRAYPRRGPVDKGRQCVGEHRGVELIGLAVDVEISARKAGREQRRAQLRCSGKQFVDKAVFGTPQRQRIEPRPGNELGRIIGAAVRRGEDQRHPRRRRRPPQLIDPARQIAVHPHKLNVRPTACHHRGRQRYRTGSRRSRRRLRMSPGSGERD